MIWTKTAAVRRADSNGALQQALRVEPRLRPVIDEAKRERNVRGYDRIAKYLELRDRAVCLVGWHAVKEELRTGCAYNAVIRAIDDLLPPDQVDQHPDG